MKSSLPGINSLKGLIHIKAVNQRSNIYAQYLSYLVKKGHNKTVCSILNVTVMINYRTCSRDLISWPYLQEKHILLLSVQLKEFGPASWMRGVAR